MGLVDTVDVADVHRIVVEEAPFACAGHGEMLPEQTPHVGRPRFVAVVQEQDVRCLADQHVVGRLFAGAVLDGRGILWLQEGGLLARPPIATSTQLIRAGAGSP